MSIEIIKERIRMIESNDFNIINEAISGSEKDIRPLFEPKDTLIGKIKTKLGFNDRNTDILNAIGVSDKNSKDIQSMVDRRLRNTYVNVDNKYFDIPKKDEDKIFKIYKLIKDKNINISDLDNNYKPKTGYSKAGNNDNILILRKSNSIEIHYDDEKLTNLESMVIINKKYNDSDFSDLANELNINKRNYNINKVNFNTKQIEISF